MKKFIFLLLAFAAFHLNPTVFAETCSFKVDPHSIQVGWTAFKTMQKVGVNGTFTHVALTGVLEKKGSLSDLLQQLGALMDLKASTDLSTGNPARDQTLFDHFFKLFKKTALIKGKIRNVKGSNSEGEFDLELSMNQKTLAVPMRFTLSQEGKFEAKGGIDVLDFNLKDAFHDLHQTCEVLHKGTDGVSKTWPTVDLKLSATIAQKCSS